MEQVLFEQHVRLVHRVKSVLGPGLRRVIELTTLFVAITSAISLLILHAIYITNSSNSHVNCLMTYYDSQNISKPSTSIHEYDIIKFTIKNTDLNCTDNTSETCENSLLTTTKNNPYDKVYLFSLDRGAMMLADETLKYHNFTILDISYDSNASCFGPPLTSRILKEYIGYDMVILNSAVSTYDGEGFMYKMKTRELFNLNHAGDFVSKKGISLINEKNSIRYKDPLVLPSLMLDFLSKLGIGEKSMAIYLFFMEKLYQIWEILENNEVLKPITVQLAWIFKDEFISTSNSGTMMNSFINLMYSASTIANARWSYMNNTTNFQQYLVFRIGVIFSTTFLFFVTTTLVSYTLRETQGRMLRFTHQLQHYIRHDLPYWSLVLSHLVESLVFVPIIVGIHFFLVEFFSDQLVSEGMYGVLLFVTVYMQLLCVYCIVYSI